MNIIKLVPENRRSYCEDRKQKDGKDYIDKRTIYQKYLELFVWKGNKNGNTI